MTYSSVSSPTAKPRFYQNPEPPAPRLGTAAHAAFELGQFEKARAYTHRGLEAVDALSSGMAKALGGESVFYGHLVLGRLALMDGDAGTARKELILAASSNGSPVLKTFGPSMRLAYDLLTRPESTEEDRKAVIAFLEGCGRFWDEDVLDEWIGIVESGNIPRFRQPCSIKLFLPLSGRAEPPVPLKSDLY